MKQRGFTLIELMVTVVILAIIAAIAIPSYLNQVQKTRRADAHAALLEAAQAMERCFTRSNSYAGCSLPATASEDGHYSISFVSGEPTATTFQIQAVAQGGQQNDAASCRTMTIDERGQKTPNPDSDRCWGS